MYFAAPPVEAFALFHVLVLQNGEHMGVAIVAFGAGIAWRLLFRLEH